MQRGFFVPFICKCLNLRHYNFVLLFTLGCMDSLKNITNMKISEWDIEREWIEESNVEGKKHAINNGHYVAW